jgi:WD40 repeat protein
MVQLSEKTNAHSGMIFSVAFSPDGTKIVSGSADGTIKVWDSGAPRALKSPHLGQNRRLLSCLADKLGLLSEKMNAHSQSITSVAFSPDGTKIVSGSYDQTIKVWDMVKWSRKDHLMFNVTTQQFVLQLLWLNKYSMKFPDDVLDLLIEACLQSR